VVEYSTGKKDLDRPLKQRETSLARSNLVTSRSFEEYCRSGIIILPDSVQGLRTLDAGGGCSDVTATLLGMGADAYAIDEGYKSRSDMFGRAKKTLTTIKRASLPPLDAWKVEPTERALETWRDSSKEHPDRYLPHIITDSTLPEGSFDLIFSFNCVTQVLDSDWEVFSAAMRKLVRLAKPGGQVQIFPFLERTFMGFLLDDFQKGVANQRRILDELKNSGLLCEVKPTREPKNDLLVVTIPVV